MKPEAKSFPYFAGGVMGPLATGVMIPMVPELRNAFDASTSAVNWGYAAYILPFSVLLIVSGTIGERFGHKRILTYAYSVFTIGSIVCALAPSLSIFITGRVIQGVANAFTTPLLIAGLAQVTEPGRLGRRVGIYSTMQAAGAAFATYLGGVAADTNWRLAFFGVAVASIALITTVPEGEPRPDAEPTPIRPLLSPRIVWLGVAIMFAAAGPLGASILVGIKARDELGLDGSATGALLLTGSIMAMLLGPLWGQVLDRFGPQLTGAVSAAVVSVLAGLLAWSSTPTSLTINWLILGGVTPIVVITFQALGAVAVPKNRAGGVSITLAWRFLGHGVGPLIFVPMWIVAPELSFILAASFGIVTVIGFLTIGESTET